MTKPDLTKFALEILGAPAGGFIVGRSHVGDALTAADLAWLPYTPNIVSIEITRDASTGPTGTAPDVGVMTARLTDRDGSEDYLGDINLRANMSIRLTYDGEPLFTGWLRDIDTEPHPDGEVGLILSAVDAVGPLANTTRYGAVSSTGSETFRDRVARVTQNANVVIEYGPDAATFPTPHEGDLWPDWSPYSAAGSTISGSGVSVGLMFAGGGEEPISYGVLWGFNPTFGGASWSVRAHVDGVETTITGLTPGAEYRLVGEFVNQSVQPGLGPQPVVVGVAGIGWGDPVMVPWWATDGVGPAEVDFVFTATSTSHVVRVAFSETWTGPTAWPNFNFGLTWRNLRVDEYRPADQYRLRDIARETSVSNHLTIAAASTDAYWWPSRHGPAKACEVLSDAVMATFTDTGPGQSYIAAPTSRSTRGVVTEWQVTNLGRDPETGNTADESTTARDTEAVATYGARAATIETSLDLTGHRVRDLARRVRRLFEVFGVAHLTPTAVSVRPADDPANVAPLDLFDLVKVTSGGHDYECRINRIHHSITGTRWVADLGLRKDH